jgi:NAD(P)-dependent dehydrogenase (short-subunit alcohol dehydrogenase family)
VLDEAATQLVQRLTSTQRATEHPSQIAFVRTDAARYGDNLRLFDTALGNHGRVDHAISAAAIGGVGVLCDEGLTLETVREPVSTTAVDVNLTGVIYFTRIASVYLRQGRDVGKGAESAIDRSITLVSSVAGFIESPGIEVYSATKHGVLGLVRSLRP